ncbi:MAG: BREX-1 system adenine-specific DNA-methyltransferase PglX [Mollicutes bacterium]|nr:BREX-1 system adenine-specific DNA-methyltransferase PglX [Mollicutes bacterium]
MDKSILKKFAIESRQNLMDKIRNKIKTFYIDDNFNSEQKGEVYVLSNEKHSLSLTNDEFKKRELLIKRVRELSLEQVIEEAAYTWFNRIIAIRYMEINDMLPLTKDNQSLGIRVLSSKDNTPDPEILKFTNLVNQDLDIDFKKEKYVELKDDNEKFKYILLLICRKLGRVIPQVFDGITDYIDILIPDNLLNDTGFITKVINEVPEENYNQVEIIGWLYQYYNQTEKDRVISAKKIYKKNEIAYATQLFTPDWIVKYMVENSLGKYWIEHSNNDNLIDNWKYFIKDNIIKNKEKLNPTEITFIDPCCGSGHILVYAFEVLYQIYLSAGYNKNDIPELILKNNLYGLDIDDRAGQLSILSVLLKAREYDKNIFNKGIVKDLNIMSIQESNTINESSLDYVNSENEKDNAKYLIENFKNAKEIGSLLILENKDYSNLVKELESNDTIFTLELKERLKPIIKVSNILTKKYDIVVTNPPYMNNSVMSNNLKNYINDNYNDVKSDLFSAFIKRNIEITILEGYIGLMTPYVWMFIATYENLRKHILLKSNFESLIQLEYSALAEATVPICSFVLNKTGKEAGCFVRLSDFKGGIEIQEKAFLNIINRKKDNYYIVDKNMFNIVPYKEIIYWISKNGINNFKYNNINEYINPRIGLVTGDTNRFLRYWYELNNRTINYNCLNNEQSIISKDKWFPYQKGGLYRKWYGNNDYVINWFNDGDEIKNKNIDEKTGRVRSHNYNGNYGFKKAITWTKISSSNYAFRYVNNGFLYDDAGPIGSCKDNFEFLMLGLYNSLVGTYYLSMLNPTLNLTPGNLLTMPFRKEIITAKQEITNIVEESILLSKEDWDSFETSWDFIRHPLVANKTGLYIRNLNEKPNFFLRSIYNDWKHKTDVRFNKLKQNEEELNRIFIDIYGLQDELTPEIEDKDITIRKADKVREVRSLISYAVGCMFGRYSLDEQGLVYAGGEFDNTKYKTYKADVDNIIPITDEAYFSDDIVERFKTFIKTVYGDNTFNENMDFIAETLGKKGTETSEETIRRYFVNDFFNDHCKIYQKRPIYWLLDSGKKNGFKALIYMHRYNENLIPKARLDYLHRVQTTYEKLLSDVNYRLTTDLSMTDKKEAKNRQSDLNAKLQEIKEYDEKIAHIANQRISIDLDDGVKVNYEKFKDILAKIK